MPNWCQNDVTFRHKDPAMLRRVWQGFYGKGLFGEFYPTPDDLANSVSPPANEDIARVNVAKYGAASWYDWNLQHWGTKWDVSEDPQNDPDPEKEHYDEIRIAFDTAWSPPEEFFSKMSEELGFEIEAYYWEPGMDFCGKWTTEGGSEYYEGSNYPLEIDSVFGISEWRAECGLDQNEEEV